MRWRVCTSYSAMVLSPARITSSRPSALYLNVPTTARAPGSVANRLRSLGSSSPILPSAVPDGDRSCAADDDGRVPFGGSADLVPVRCIELVHSSSEDVDAAAVGRPHDRARHRLEASRRIGDLQAHRALSRVGIEHVDMSVHITEREVGAPDGGHRVVLAVELDRHIGGNARLGAHDVQPAAVGIDGEGGEAAVSSQTASWTLSVGNSLTC